MLKNLSTNYKILILASLNLVWISTLAFTFPDLSLRIEVPISGLHTRKNVIPLRGTVNDTRVKLVKITLDGATLGELNVACVDGGFESELQLGSGKTTVSVWAKAGDGKTTESGVVVYRDCTVSTVVGSYSCFVNSTEESLLNPTILVLERSFVPLRELANFYGATVSYDPKTKQIGLSLGRRKSYVTIGKETAAIGGKKATCNPAPRLINYVTYVPARFFAEMIGGGVAWHSGSRTLAVSVP